MATISSPRTQSPAPPRVQSPTISFSPSTTPSSSVRPSLEIPRIDNRSTSPVPPNASQRRNRAALRDYYNLKSKPTSSRPEVLRTASITSTASNDTTTSAALQTALEDSTLPPTLKSQLDEEDFDAEAYVQQLLESSSLRTILKAEGSLVSEIKNLDGERKALVYDNYSKLIAATRTIGTMRSSMDEVGGGNLRSIGMLAPAVDAVVRSAAELNRGADLHDLALKREQRHSVRGERLQQETVKWVLRAPERLQQSLKHGQRKEADADWKEVRELLGKWNDVRGSAELQVACEEIMAQKLPFTNSND